MKIRNFFFILAGFVFSIALISGNMGCGQPIPPTGGPRDSLPPRFVSSLPKDSALNFNGNRIVLQFDEYIQLENPFEKVILSPLPKTNPQIDYKLKTITIRLKDTLEPNTTYSFNFGDALKDINENNPLYNFTYTFSTGDKIDSSQLTGNVLLAETGKIDTTLIVVLHRNLDDSAVAKERPRYFSRLNGKGEFIFRFLAAGKYNIFALKDVDGGKKFDQPSELIGFLDQPVNIGANNQPVTLYAFTDYKEEKKPVAVTAPDARNAPNALLRRGEDKRFRYTTRLENGQQDLLSSLQVEFERKVKTYDTAKFMFTDGQFQPITSYALEIDSTARKFTLAHSWKEDTEYKLIIQKDFAQDTAGNTVTRTDTVEFKTKKEADYGSIRVRIVNPDTANHPVLFFYKNDAVEKIQPIISPDFTYKFFRPGEYELRILYDRNNNDQWDAGNYWRKLQPEKVVVRPDKFNVRPNWDNELTIDLRQF